MGHDIGTALMGAACYVEDAEALATADMILEAAKVENIWHAEDLHNADGEAFEGYGSLNVPSSRLAPEYMAVTSRRARRRVTDALGRCRPQSGEHLRLVTLTMPKLSGIGFTKTMAVFDKARVLLRKRDWFKDTFRGGVSGSEFTFGQDGDAYHVHSHTMAWSKWVVWQTLGEVWTSCLEAAASAHGLEMNFATSHGRAVVDVRLVTPKRRGKGTVAMDDAVKEVAKYITKGNTFAAIPPAQLVEVERTLRGRRMVETFGEANQRKGKIESGALIAHIEGEIQSGEVKDTYLDTQDTVDGKNNKPEAEKVRSESLRKVGARMILAGQRREWLEMLQYIYAKRREWRKAQLAKRFPVATFRTLSGEIWYGVDIVKSRTLSDGVKVIQRGRSPFCGEGFSASQHRTASSLA